MIYIIWSGSEGSSGWPEDFYFATKKAAEEWLKGRGYRYEKQGYGPPLWAKHDFGYAVWADIYPMPSHEEYLKSMGVVS